MEWTWVKFGLGVAVLCAACSWMRNVDNAIDVVHTQLHVQLSQLRERSEAEFMRPIPSFEEKYGDTE
jgi:hypothetical protein